VDSKKEMALKYLISLLIVAVMQKPVWSQVYQANNGAASFRSDAPLELITADSRELKGRFDISKKTFAFVIRIASFNGFNSPLQKEHFNENYMETDKFPTATFGGKVIEDIDLKTDGTYTVRAKGNLQIHGVVQERIIKSVLVVKNGVISIKSNFTVLLSDHNIPIPKVVHEKLASEIKIEINADLTTK
jgi:hypothetical protein